MPSSATITTWYVFTGGVGNKAYSAQVNHNFSVFRGHHIPLVPGTAAAANLTYDLGSSEYHWSTFYVGNIDLYNFTTTQALVTQADTSHTHGSLSLKISGTTRYEFGANTMSANLNSSATSTHSFNLNGTQKAAIGSLGFTYTSFAARGSTTTASGRHVAKSAYWSKTYSTTVATDIKVAGSTITVTVTDGRPVFVGLMNGNTITSFEWSVTGTNPLTYIQITRNGSLIARYAFKQFFNASGYECDGFEHPLNLWTLDVPGAGTHKYAIVAEYYTGAVLYMAAHTVAFQF